MAARQRNMGLATLERIKSSSSQRNTVSLPNDVDEELVPTANSVVVFDDVKLFNDMMAHLATKTTIALDLEVHQHRCY